MIFGGEKVLDGIRILYPFLHLLLIFACIAGYSCFLEARLAIRGQFAPICTIAFISVALIFFGYMGLLFPGIYIMYILGLGLFVFGLLAYPRIYRNNLYLYGLTGLLMLVYTGLFLRSNVGDYDAFSHWGLAVRLMQTSRALPGPLDKCISFSDYPLAMPIFCLFNSARTVYQENLYQQAHALVLVFSVLPILPFSRKMVRGDMAKRVFMGLVFVFTLALVEVANVRTFTMYIDTILATVAFALSYMVYYHRKDVRQVWLPFLLLGSFLISIKHSGLIFLLFSLLLLVFFMIKERKISLKLVMAILIPFIVQQAWILHHKRTFVAEKAAKHSISFARYSEEMASKGKGNVDMIVNMFIDRNVGDIYWYILIALLAIGLISLLVTKKKFWLSLAGLSVFALLTSIAYQVGNLFMYLFSMPIYEARVLASYDRYFNSMKIYIGLLFLAWFLSVYRKNIFYIGLSLVMMLGICLYDHARLSHVLVPADRLAHDVDMYRFKEVMEDKISDNELTYPTTTYNKQVTVYTKKGYDYKTYLVCKYILLTDDISIKKYDKNNFNDRKALANSIRNGGLVVLLK